MVTYERDNGNNTIVLWRNETDKYPFGIGVGMAKLILDNIEEIKKFVAENAGEKKENG
jgi:hypothetical protein